MLSVSPPRQVERPSSGPTAGGGSSSSLVEVLEAKGLDMVRRDWSNLSKDTGNYVLQQILSGGCLWGGRVLKQGINRPVGLTGF